MASLSTLANFKPTEEVAETVTETPIVNEVVENTTTETPVTETVTETQETPIEQQTNESTFTLDFEQPEIKETDAQQATTQTEAKSWKDLIKEVDPKEILKELGVQDFALELNEYIKNGGDATDYISAKGVDWNKVSDVDLVFNDLKKEFPDATQAQLQSLFNKRYNQHELADDEDKELGVLTLQRDARKLRNAEIERQSKFKIPEKIQVQQGETQEQIFAKIQSENEKVQKEIIQFYENNEATKSLLTSKRVAVDLGEAGMFNYNIDKPELITKMLVDADTWRKVTSTPQGEPDVQKLQLLAMIASNPKKALTDIFNYGKSLGKQSVYEEGQNAKRPTGTMPSNGTDEKPTYSLGKGGIR
jgi:hypothetical protein